MMYAYEWTKIAGMKYQELMFLRNICTPDRELIPSRGLCICVWLFVCSSVVFYVASVSLVQRAVGCRKYNRRGKLTRGNRWRRNSKAGR